MVHIYANKSENIFQGRFSSYEKVKYLPERFSELGPGSHGSGTTLEMLADSMVVGQYVDLGC